MKSQKGFVHIIVVVAVIAVIGIIGFAGWRVYDVRQAKNNASVAAPVTSQAEQQINNTQDVSKAQQDLDQLSIDEELNPAALDADIESLQ